MIMIPGKNSHIGGILHMIWHLNHAQVQVLLDIEKLELLTILSVKVPHTKTLPLMLAKHVKAFNCLS